MSDLKDKDQLKKHLQQDLLGEIPIFFHQCIVQPKEDAAKRYVNVTAYGTTQYQPSLYYKVVSKII